MFNKIGELFGYKGTLTPAAVGMIFIFAAAGTVSMPVFADIARDFRDDFRKLTLDVAEMKLAMASALQRAQQRDQRITSLEANDKERLVIMADHDRRLTRVETLTEVRR